MGKVTGFLEIDRVEESYKPVEERIKMIAVEEIKTIKNIRAAQIERMEAVDKLFAGNIDGGWVSKWLQIPIREQNNFVSEIEKKVDEIKKDTEAQQSNEDGIKIIKRMFNKLNPDWEGMPGLEQ